MSFLNQLNANGVTAEDLEKAASVRLFEKAAAAESYNSTELRNNVGSLLTNNPTHNMENPMDYIDLFEKQAADEGIDLDLLDDYELAELYEHFVDDVAYDDYDEDYDDTYEKLAEAELLGEVMADSYLDKVAGARVSPFNYGEAYKDRSGSDRRFDQLRNYGTKTLTQLGNIGMTKTRAAKLEIAAARMAKAKDITKAEAMGRLLRRSGAMRAGGAIGGGAALGAGAYALAKKRMSKKAAAPATAESFYKRRGKKRSDGTRGMSTGQSLARRGRLALMGVGTAATSKKRSLMDAASLDAQIAKMSAKEQAALLKSLGQKGYAGELKAALMQRKMVRRGGALGAGLGLAAAGAGYAASRMNKKASLIEELALEKAASWVDGDFEFDEIDVLSDELAEEIIEDAMYEEDDYLY